jgi:hypothetical protein
MGRPSIISVGGKQKSTAKSPKKPQGHIHMKHSGSLHHHPGEVHAIKELCNIGTINEGDFVGHSAMMEDQNLSASVIAVKPCTVYSLKKTALSRILREHPSIGAILQSAIGRCIENMNDELGRHNMITSRGEFLNSVKQRFKRETHLYHNINKLVMSSELDSVHAESVLGKTNFHTNPHSSDLLGKSLRSKRFVIPEKESFAKVDNVLNSDTVFYDSEHEQDIEISESQGLSKRKSVRRRMTELLVNKHLDAKSSRPSPLYRKEIDDDGLSYEEWQDKLKEAENALFNYAKKKSGLRRHRSSDDLLQESARDQQFTRLNRTARINPFKIPLYQMPHKASKEMQLMTPEEIERRKTHTHAKNSKLKLLRRQSFPSLGNEYWKEDFLHRGLV